MEDDATQLVIQLEDNLGLGEVHNGIPLIGVLMADKLPNHGATKGILRKSWEQMGEAKISIVKDNVLAITVESEEMAGRIIEGGPWAVMGFPNRGFGIFTKDLQAKAFRPSLRRGVGENTSRNYHSNLSTLACGNQASEMERE
ncbi:unnamed protein product [Prunus armeniaca]